MGFQRTPILQTLTPQTLILLILTASYHAFHPVALKVSLSSMLAMQAERGGLASHAFHAVALKSLESCSLTPAGRTVSLSHVSHAGRGGGAFSRFLPTVALSPALSRSPDHHAFLPVALGLSGKSYAFDPVALKSLP
jgi:hypothetical protein